MFGNYFKVAWRNLIRGRLYSFINIAGLSVGTAVVILLALFAWDEWTFDAFHSKGDRIYRAWVKEHVEDEVFFNTITPYILGQTLRENFPEIEEVVRYTQTRPQVRKGEFTEQELVHVVEPGFLKILDFPLIHGNMNDALAGIHNVVITEDISQKYFSTENSIGQTLTMQIAGQWTDFQVSGVIANPPANTGFQYHILIPFENTKTYISEGGQTSWTVINVETLVLLNTGNNVRDLEAKIATVVDEKTREIYDPGQYIVGLQPLRDIHLNQDYPEGFLPVSDRRYPYILSGVALLILLLACINFAALAVGRSLTRAKEVGVRKAMGASRTQVMQQYWSEAILTACAGIIFGTALAKIALPGFNILADKTLSLPLNLTTIGFLAVLALVTGAVSGAYPSLILSGFSPVKVLRGAFSHARTDKHLVLRGLVGFQFLLSILLIICTIVMAQQLRFIQNKNLGFNKEHLVVVPYSRSGVRLSELYGEGQQILGRLRHLANEKSTLIPGISMATHAFGTPGWLKLGYAEEEVRFRQFYVCGIDYEFLPMMDIDLLEGKHFNGETSADNRSAIVNQTFAREFDVAVGSPLPEPFQEYIVSGITDDFHYQSLHTEVGPLVMVTDPIGMASVAPDLVYDDFPSPKLFFKVKGDELTQALTWIQMVWRSEAPEQPFRYTFLDENLGQQYKSESRLSKVIGIATGLAVLIACLGLFGMITLSVARRTREIGIRKILGASTAQLTGRLSKDFLKVVLLAAIPACIVAWFVMNAWLQDYAYRIDMQWWVFGLAAFLALFIAIVTTGFQSIRASLANPVESLRSE